MKVDFSKIKVEINFEGETAIVDVRHSLANFAKLRTNDIGFEDFCREIYHSEGDIEISDEYAELLIGIVELKDCQLLATVKREIINRLKQ